MIRPSGRPIDVHVLQTIVMTGLVAVYTVSIITVFAAVAVLVWNDPLRRAGARVTRKPAESLGQNDSGHLSAAG